MKQNEAQKFAPLVTKDNEPLFEEPWQAQVMALAFAASQKGIFSASEWSNALSAELRRTGADDSIDEHDHYYLAALRALQSLLQADGVLSQEAVVHRESQWRRAYLNTPHGMPVELS